MRTLFIFLFLFTISSLRGQGMLDQYIKEGIDNNIVLKQRRIALDRAVQGLKIAQGMFLPSIGLQGSYTSGDGGRNISIPIGDLLNPVYATLNQLTSSDQFPQVENVNTNFFPRDLYDVRVRTSVPIINSDLIYGKKIQQQQVVLQEYEVLIYKRELIKNIQVAYYNYLSAIEAVAIYQSALERALEGKRVNESLLNNGKGLQAYILRSQSEVENIQAQIQAAKNQTQNAQMYFNFLLNRDLTAAIEQPSPSEIDIATASALVQEPASASRREELQQVRESISIQHNILRMNQAYSTPKLSGFLDLGSQYEGWKFNNQSRYYLFGFQLDVPLFNGFTNQYKISQSRMDKRNAELNLESVTKQLDMSAGIARNGLTTALENYQSAQKQLDAAKSYQRLIDKGYKEGINTFIEAVDARNQITSAQLQTIINQYQVLIAKAQYEREIANQSTEIK